MLCVKLYLKGRDNSNVIWTQVFYCFWEAKKCQAYNALLFILLLSIGMSCGKSQSAVGLLFAFNFQKKKKNETDNLSE